MKFKKFYLQKKVEMNFLSQVYDDPKLKNNKQLYCLLCESIQK